MQPRAGLHHQQQSVLLNNNQNKLSSSASSDKQSNNQAAPAPASLPRPARAPAPASRHSPPPSPPVRGPLAGLGSLSEVWGSSSKWEQFTAWLETVVEGEDSDGVAITAARYSVFLQLYSELEEAERAGRECSDLVTAITQHKEAWLGRERGLAVLDSGVRQETLRRIAAEPAGPGVLSLVVPRVVDRLGELLAHYQATLLPRPVTQNC